MYRVKLLIANLAILTCLVQILGCATARVNPTSLPKGVKVKKSVTVPTDVALAVYMPKSMIEAHFFMQYTGRRVEPGKALHDAVMSVSGQFFPDTQLVDLQSERAFGLLLDLEPEWEFEGGNIHLDMKYRVLDTHQNVVLESSKKYKASVDYNDPTVSFFNAATRAAQLMMVDVLNKLAPTSAKYAAVNPISSVDGLTLADLEEPISSGTAFNINADGDMLTAAHVIRRCLVVRAQFGEEVYDAKIVQSSDLLDVAVLSTDFKSQQFLQFRRNQDFVLGEKISTVSFPLKGLLDASPNLTVGNISSKKALTGSLGQYQFSAPIQPGSSGGSIVSENGEVLGIVTGTLNVAALAERGIIPQSINFALDAKYITRFLDRYKVKYHEMAKPKKDVVGTEAALASTVQLTCYQ